MSLAPGSRFGRHEVVAFVGAGGMGEVYRARDTELGRDVALKVLRPECGSDDGARRRLMQEARTASAPDHPHITTVHDVVEVGGLRGGPASQITRTPDSRGVIFARAAGTGGARSLAAGPDSVYYMFVRRKRRRARSTVWIWRPAPRSCWGWQRSAAGSSRACPSRPTANASCSRSASPRART
jgi:hypothetical protein